ncbi:DUF4249 domain-containing protein [Flagellimonas marina]|uniref:DUF4249 domain-containing protein n=1 Tax=Flagellimonas marina TaxID=1775168 RepID=A0ABV8PM25_9FLAO
MKRLRKIGLLLTPMVFLSLQLCIEPFDTSYVEFESALVIDATITDESKHQEIHISRTYEFEADGPTGESGAEVQVLAGNGNTYDFTEGQPGTYLSNQIFSADPNLEYTLAITTKDGRNYVSTAVQMMGKSSLDSLYAIRTENDFGEDGMGIFVDGSSSGNGPGYYRYEYEETYKVVAPDFVDVDIILVEQPAPLQPIPEYAPRSGDEFICYPTDYSTSLILNDTKDLNVDRYKRFNARFISSENFIISYRYSILVRQYSQSETAYRFYETLSNFATSESLFSETQPGFLAGNIVSQQDRNEKVLGYFDVASVDEKRIFFNYDEYYPEENLPPYVDPCRWIAPLDYFSLVEANLVKYVKDYNDENFFRPGPFIFVPRVCGDCTALGPSEAPEFWIE